MKNYRIGFGFDVHRISRRRKGLVLGGAKIPCVFGLAAVSDGDVLLHALSDAICGACGLGDIGDYFPPSKQYKGLDSKKIVEFILNKVNKKFKIVNIDITIVADKPKLVKQKKSILASLKKLIPASGINLKVKSKENLDILGGKNSISCFAFALISKKK